MFFHGHASFWGVFSSANRFGKETNSMGYEINHHNLYWWCLSVCANSKYPSAQWIIVLVTFQWFMNLTKNGNIAWCQDMHAVQLMQIRWYKHHLKLRPWPNKLDSFSSSPSWTRCPHEQLLIPWGGYRLDTRLKTKKALAERLTAKKCVLIPWLCFFFHQPLMQIPLFFLPDFTNAPRIMGEAKQRSQG